MEFQWEESQNTVCETEVRRINPQKIKHAQMCHLKKKVTTLTGIHM